MAPKDFQPVLLVMEQRDYGNRIALGVAKYARLHTPWAFCFATGHQACEAIKKFRGVGVILQNTTEESLQAVASCNLPVVTTSMFAAHQLPQVGSDDVEVGRMAAEHLLNRRFQNLAIYKGLRLPARFRRRGFLEATRQAGIDVLEIDPAHDLPWEQCNRRLGSILQTASHPLAVFCVTDAQASELTYAALTAGLRVPEDVALLGVDNDPLCCNVTMPPLSSVNLPLEQIGYKAAEVLHEISEGKPPPSEPILFPPLAVVARRSTDALAVRDREVASAVRFIHNNLDEFISVDDVAEHVFLSRRSLERRFREVLNRTVADEMRRARVDHVRRLLRETDMNLTAICAASGFRTPTLLNRVFRRLTGMSPAAYRRGARG